MTETTRGNGVWYREDVLGRKVRLPRVRKVITRIGDDANRQGPFRITASTANIETIDETVPVNRPGQLLLVDDFFEVTYTEVEKSSDRVVDHVIIDRRIKGLGAWSKVAGKKASTPLFQNITIAEAIRHVLDAIDAPVGHIDATPQAVLNWFWLSDQDDAAQVLIGLAEMGGVGARLDDYDGAISFRTTATGGRLGFYGAAGGEFGPPVVSAAAQRGSAANTPYQGGLDRRRDGSWIAQPNLDLRLAAGDAADAYLLERLDTYQVGAQWYLRATISSQATNPVFTASTADGTRSLRPIVEVDSGVDTLLGGVLGGSGGANFVFVENEEDNGQNKGIYRRAITVEQATELGGHVIRVSGGTAAQANTTFDRITAPGESGILTFQRFERHDEDSRYFNTIRVGTVSRVLSGEGGGAPTVLWTSAQDVTVNAASSRSITIPAIPEGQEVIQPVLGTDYTFVQITSFFTVPAPSVSVSGTTLTIAVGGPDPRSGGIVVQGLQVRTRPATTVNVWSSPEDVQIAANATLGIRLSAPRDSAGRDSPFTGLVRPVVGTDYTVSAGSVASIGIDKTSGVEATLTIRAGASGATLQNLKVRGRLLIPGIESGFINQDEAARARDGEIAWESAGIVPQDIDADYLGAWSSAMLERGLQRGWTCTLHCLAADVDGYREQWATLLRLRPGRLVHVLHSRGVWEGVVRQIERTAGSSVDHVDRYKITCELTNLEDIRANVIRIGLTPYGNDQVLG